MSNRCLTSYNIQFESKAAADKAKSILEYIQSNPIYKYLSSSGQSWLGNIIEFFGLPVGDKKFPVSCRGDIEYWAQDERSIQIETNTAWNMMPDAISLFRLLGDCKIGYEAEEPTDDVFINDGSFYNTEWMYYTDDYGCEYLSSKDMRSVLERLFKEEGLTYSAEETLEDLVDFYNMNTERTDFSIHKFDAIPVEEITSFSLEQAKERIKFSPIPVYEVRYKKDGEEYRTFVGVSEIERFMQAIDKLREAGYEMVSFTPCKKGRTAFELWLESTDRVREAAAV